MNESELKKEVRLLVQAGRRFLLSLEDTELTTKDDGTEYTDVKNFRDALARAVKVGKP